MSKSALAQISEHSYLEQAWARIWRRARRQTSTGIDDVQPSAFNSNLLENLRRTRLALLDGYRFSSPRPHPVPKPNGKDRIICVPTVQDRLVQSAIGEYLRDREDRLGIWNEASYGFIRKRQGHPKGVNAARKRAVLLGNKHNWVYKSDITSFFDQIGRSLLEHTIRKSVRIPSIEDLLVAATHCEAKPDYPSVERRVRKAGIKAGRGVRQGMPLSPFYANLVLRDFDRKLLAQNFALIRYADDFIVFGENQSVLEQVDEIARTALAVINLKIPELGTGDKTQICDPDEPVDFLGLSLCKSRDYGYDLIISDKQFSKIEDDLSPMCDLDFLVSRGYTFGSAHLTAERRISGLKSAYRHAANISRLEAELDNGFSYMWGEFFGAYLDRTPSTNSIIKRKLS